MSKKGETRPWRVDFKWSNGVSSNNTLATRELAEAFIDQLTETAGRMRLGATIELRRRIDGPRGSYLLVSTREVALPEEEDDDLTGRALYEDPINDPGWS